MIDGNLVIDMQHHFIPAEALQFIGKTPEHDFTDRSQEVPQGI